MKILFVTLEQSGIENLKSILNNNFFKKNYLNIFTYGMNENYLNFKDLKNFEIKPLMGLSEIILNIPYLFRLRNAIFEITRIYNFSHIFFVDSFDFTKFYLKKFKMKNISYCQIIGPSVFLWNTKKANYINNNISKIFSIFNIEKKYYSKNVYSFIGYPLIERTISKKSNYHQIKNIGIFLGSRNQEINHNVKEIKKLLTILIKNHELNINIFTTTKFIKKLKNYFANDNLNYILNDKNYYRSLSNLDFAFACSGTVHLELFFSNIPHVIFYKTNYLNFLFVKTFIKIKYISLMNIFNDKEIIKEFIQFNFKSYNLYNFFLNILENRDEFKNYASNILNKRYRSHIKKPNYLPIIDYLKKSS